MLVSIHPSFNARFLLLFLSKDTQQKRPAPSILLMWVLAHSPLLHFLCVFGLVDDTLIMGACVSTRHVALRDRLLGCVHGHNVVCGDIRGRVSATYVTVTIQRIVL